MGAHGYDGRLPVREIDTLGLNWGHAMRQWYYAQQDQQKGPVDEATLKQLAASGTVRPEDLLWTEGMKEWVPARRLGNLFPAPLASPPVLPPPLPAPTNTLQNPIQPLGYYNPATPHSRRDLGDDPAMRWLLPVGRSGWAIAAGYLGLFGLLACPAPLALIISIIAIIDLKRHPDRHGMGRAIFGLVVGILGTLFLFTLLLARIIP